jgi:uncharacterized membrane protein
MPYLGCAFLLVSFFFFCILPYFVVDAMRLALENLHLSPQTALLAVIGIFLGSLINLPVYRIPRADPQPVEPLAVYGLEGLFPTWQQMRRDTVIAINVGGCLIPLVLAAYQARHVVAAGSWAVTALIVAATVSILVCYRFARPVQGIGIMMPALAPPLASILVAWMLLGGNQYDGIRAPVAFIAGVLGPLVGADLLHLPDIRRVPAGMLSIGGAGTFDGIVISGLVAAYFA